MLGLWLVLFALTISPQLHRLLHEDADGADHHCLVTQIQHQPVLSGFVAAVLPAAPVLETVCTPLADVRFVPAYDYRLSPSRAPPAAFSFPCA